MARPTKFTEPVKRKVIEGLAIGLTYDLAARYAGIHEATLYIYLAKGREGQPGFLEFFEECKKAEARCAAGSLGVIIQAAQDGKWQPAAWMLERRFGYKAQQDPVVEINVESETVNVKQLITDLKGSKDILEKIMGPKVDLDE